MDSIVSPRCSQRKSPRARAIPSAYPAHPNENHRKQLRAADVVLHEVVVKVLITGATGFIGGYLAQTFVREGCQVRALTRPTSDTSRLRELDVEIISGDIRDASAAKKAVQGCEFVYHLAAKTTKDHLSKKEYYAHNVQGTRNVAQAALEAGVHRLVYASTIGVYGTSRSSTIDEN